MDVVADTNIWLRLADDQAVQHASAKQCLINLLRQQARIYLLPQNVIEFWAVATRPTEANGFGWSVERTITEVAKLKAQFPILPENPGIFEKWSETVESERIGGKKVHDARLAAQLSVHKIPHLLTFNDQDFEKFKWISILRPADLLAVPKERDGTS